MSSREKRTQFALLLRILHWLMAASLLAMVFIGLSMVSSLDHYHRLLAIHRPLGVLIFILAAIRLGTRLVTGAPALPPSMSPAEVIVAKASECLLYTLFFALPLVGWACFQQVITQSPCSDRCIFHRSSPQNQSSTPRCVRLIPCSPICCS